MRALALMGVLAAGTADAASADWTAVTVTDAASGRSRVEAGIGDEAGNRLSVYRGDDAAITLRFSLRPGLRQLAPGSCATFIVDDLPMNADAPAPACATTATASDITIARIEAQSVRSPELDALVNGGSLLVRYALAGAAGYESARFSLRGSKQAVRDAIGRDVLIVSDR